MMVIIIIIVIIMISVNRSGVKISVPFEPFEDVTGMDKNKTKKCKKKIDTDDIFGVYAVLCTYFDGEKQNVHTHVFKSIKMAREKAENLHDELCDKTIFKRKHTYKGHKDVGIVGIDETKLNIEVEKRELCLANDEIFSFSSSF